MGRAFASRVRLLLALGLAVGCGSPSPAPTAEPAAQRAEGERHAAPENALARGEVEAVDGPTDAPPEEAAAEEAVAEEGAAAAPTRPELAAPLPISAERALAIAYLGEPSAEASACLGLSDDPARIRCMLGLRFARDADARDLALALYDETGSVAGLEEEYTRDAGWRGVVHFVPELPVGRHRRHLQWILDAFRDHARFFAAIEARAERPLPYRNRPLSFHFYRSVGRTTPSAYASPWRMGWNVVGSLHRSADHVRETLFHETFHMNDRVREMWSVRTLSTLYDGIVARCTRGDRLDTPCLDPYAPNDTRVRRGTYYAFQPNNGLPVAEYAAELSIRYYEEQSAALAAAEGRAPASRPPPFKCGPPENAEAWGLLVEEFFAGVDLVPPCAAAGEGEAP